MLKEHKKKNNFGNRELEIFMPKMVEMGVSTYHLPTVYPILCPDIIFAILGGRSSNP